MGHDPFWGKERCEISSNELLCEQRLANVSPDTWLMMLPYAVLSNPRKKEIRKLAESAVRFTWDGFDESGSFEMDLAAAFPHVSSQYIGMATRAVECIREASSMLLPNSRAFCSDGCVTSYAFFTCIHESLCNLVIAVGVYGLSSDDLPVVMGNEAKDIFERISADPHTFSAYDEIHQLTDFGALYQLPDLDECISKIAEHSSGGFSEFEEERKNVVKDGDEQALFYFDFSYNAEGLQLCALSLVLAVKFLTEAKVESDFLKYFNIFERALRSEYMAAVLLRFSRNAVLEDCRFRGFENRYRLLNASKKRHSSSRSLQDKYCPLIHDLVTNQGRKIGPAIFSIEDQVLADARQHDVQFKADNYERTLRNWYTKWRKQQGLAVQKSGSLNKK